MSARATHLDPARAAHYRGQGWWLGRTLDEEFRAAVARFPDRRALIDDDITLTYADLDEAVTRLASALWESGIRRGSVVSFQLPNWWEAAVVFLAASRLGAVANPLHMIYRQHELGFVLRQAGSSIVFVPEAVRGTPYAANVREVVADLPSRPEVVTVRGDDRSVGRTYDGLIASAGGATTFPPGSAEDILLLMYTSGTTSDPKGVLHSHDTLLRAGYDLADVFGLTHEDVAFVPSPITHVAGLLRVQGPLCRGAAVVLLDRWDPEVAMDRVLAHGCTYTGGAIPFVRGLADVARSRGLSPAEIPLRSGPVGGADVPPAVVQECDAALGTCFYRIYGLTEGVTVTATRPEEPLELRAGTDGTLLPGMEVRILDEAGVDAPVGVVGEVIMRGPANFLGYLDASLNTASFLPGSWVRTGDLGSIDTAGYLTIHGRSKDIIIRGGENISAREVEDLLIQHPDVRDVAIVAMPDDRLGEKACAFVVLEERETIGLDDVVAFLRTKKIAPQKLPEHLVVMPDGLPLSATGKIRRAALRDLARTEAARTASRAGGS